ncbi:MAG: sigma-70 family RNA polymerase sigma factor [bacterium]|nr:sigma-70 family RNA polymerase sigma factor [bacterium]
MMKPPEPGEETGNTSVKETEGESEPISVRAASQLEPTSDRLLMQRFQAGEEAVFDTLVERYQAPLYTFVVRMLGDANGGKDILQETFLRVWEHRDQYREVAQFSTWLYTIAANLVRSELRKRKLRRWLPLGHQSDDVPEIDPPDDGFLPDEYANSSGLRTEINLALKALPREFREAVVLRDINDLSYEEIATVLKIPVGTVKSRVNRGRARLQEQLRDYV